MKLRYFIASTALFLSFSSFAGDYELSCNSPQTEMCGEYTFDSRSDRDNFKKRCKSGGGDIVSSCESGPSCSHSTVSRTVTTYVYNKNSRDVKRSCDSNRGDFNE